MKQRLITAACGLSILFVVFCFFDTALLNIAVSVVIVIMLHELISAAGLRKNRKLEATALLFGALIPFLRTALMAGILSIFCFALALILFIILLHDHETLRIEQIGFTIFFTLAIALSMNCFVFLRDSFGTEVGMYGMVMALCGAWMCDAGAYFFGSAYGKHKLAPSISPNKSVEGLIGGIVVGLVSQLIAAYAYTMVMSSLGAQLEIDMLAVAITSPLLSAMAVVGDLSASVIKRQFGIKDFGSIMPGHGGLMDRFDSVLLSLPVVYIIFRLLPIAEVL